MGAIPEVDIASSAFKADPYPYFARLRAEAPVLRGLESLPVELSRS